MKRISLFSLPLLLLAIGWLSWQGLKPVQASAPLLSPLPEKIKGISWEAARGDITAAHVGSLQPYHVNWMAQTPFGWQAAYDQPELVFNGSRGMWGERDSGLIKTALLAREMGIKTMLKPHIWLRERSEGKWRSDIEMQNEADWKEWFANYEAFILHYARLAESQHFEAFCIGTELYIASSTHEAEWRDLIQKVREVYSGQLTFAANFYKEYEAIAFWDALDFIGVQAYFPLTKSVDPTVKALKKGWAPHFAALKQIHQKWNKPVVFTEVGYRSSRDAGVEPWVWPERGEVAPDKISAQTQAHCYEAMFETFWKEDWMGGLFLWQWSPQNYGWEPGENSRRRGTPSPVSFCPKAEGLLVLQKWFEK